MPNVFKAARVLMNNDNIVNISVDRITPAPETEELPSSVFEQETAEDESKKILSKASNEARKILDKAREESDAMIASAKSQAESEAKQIKESAREDGYTEGHTKAVAEGEKIKTQAKKLLSDTQKECADLKNALEPDIVQLIIGIVAKLLDDTVKIQPDVIVNLIRQGMAGTTLTGEISVHVSPQDFEIVTENKDALLALTDGSVHLDIIRDQSLSAMDCVIETSYGNIDCSLGQQFEALRQNLTYILQGKSL